ncbi:MAG: tRNA (adenosine(37)-N6)-threonylcarbamoyltransferase complex ATPase subunit type 1 TsaE [Candidatus Moranbacteria bacterium]|nr:tRNA (adenosine(37)-N6)-threonylcarbamoyltransferase complex ATPase subunit type 1 TsaE [Candidatus Moranbacteria bacterium]
MDQYSTTHSAEETRAFGKKLAGEIVPGTTLCLQGDLGAGKTTLVQGLLESLGAERPYVSPTFVIMKQYDLPAPSATGIRRIYHADAYRVEEKDFREIGFAEWCADDEGLVILEWPERISNMLPQKRIDVTLQSLSETEREISLKENS